MTTPLTAVQGTSAIFLRANNDYMAAGYDLLCIEKSFISASGPFSEITAAAAAAATKTGNKKELFSLGTDQFDFYIDGVLQSVVFAGETTALAAAAAVTAQTTAVAVDSGGYVQLSSPTTGLSSSLEVRLSTEAGITLGFYADDYDIGEAARIALVTDQLLYSLVDYHTDPSYWYRARLYSTSTLTYGDYFTPFVARPYDSVPVANLIYGTLQLMDSEGKPVEGRMITVEYRRLGAVGAKVINGPMYSYYTDAAGAIDVPLVKESEIRVAVEGTRMVRDVQVPSTGSSFSLFDPSVQEFDELGIASYNAPDLTRESF